MNKIIQNVYLIMILIDFPNFLKDETLQNRSLERDLKLIKLWNSAGASAADLVSFLEIENDNFKPILLPFKLTNYHNYHQKNFIWEKED